MQTTFLKVNEFEYHLNGGYVPSVDRFEVRVSSTFTQSRTPEDHRKLLQLILTEAEIDNLINALIEIRNNVPLTQN